MSEHSVARNPLLDGLVALAVAGVLVYLFITTEAKQQTTPPNDFKNSSYQIDNTTVQLVDGVGKNEVGPGLPGTITTTYFGNEVAADMNNDGHEDRAFLLTQDSGGSGVFFYVAAALGSADGFTGINAILLGDRIAPQSSEWRDNTLIINYADRRAGEPMTVLPSIGVSKLLKIENSALVEVK